MNLDGLLIVLGIPAVGYSTILINAILCWVSVASSRRESSLSDKAISPRLAAVACFISALGMLLIYLMLGKDFLKALKDLWSFHQADWFVFFFFWLPINGTALSIPLSLIVAFVIFRRIRRAG